MFLLGLVGVLGFWRGWRAWIIIRVVSFPREDAQAIAKMTIDDAKRVVEGEWHRIHGSGHPDQARVDDITSMCIVCSVFKL